MTCACEETYSWQGSVNDELSMCFELASTADGLKTLVVDTTARSLKMGDDTFVLPEEAIHTILSSTTCERQIAFWEEALQEARKNRLVACKLLNL